MKPVVPPPIEEYAQAHTTEPGGLLAELAETTRARLRAPQMMVGPLEGRFLEMLVFALGARRVLEIGTFSGYSALSMAAGLPPDGRIVTCEIDPEAAALARTFVARSPHAARIDIREGPALATVAALDGPFDFVFIDADKTNYLRYYEAVLPKLSDRGLIAADNTLWQGAVLDASDTTADTEALRAFNDHVRRDVRVACVLLTVRDGITLIRRAPS